VIVTVVVVVAAVGIGVMMSNKSGEVAQPTATVSPTGSANGSASPQPSPTPMPTPASTSTPAPTASGVSGQVKEFTVVGVPFSFNPAEIRVKKGDTVRIIFRNEKGTHDWVIDEFNARTKILQVGQTETIQFVANKAGTFEYYCSVGTHRQMGMKGNLVVE